MLKTSAQEGYLHYLRSQKKAASSCSAATALRNHTKKKKATIVKDAEDEHMPLIGAGTGLVVGGAGGSYLGGALGKALQGASATSGKDLLSELVRKNPGLVSKGLPVAGGILGGAYLAKNIHSLLQGSPLDVEVRKRRVKESQWEIDPAVLEAMEYHRQLSQNPMLIDQDTQGRLQSHNEKALRTAGSLLGGAGGALGLGGLGAGIGTLLAGAGRRAHGASYGALAGAGVGSILGGLLGKSYGKSVSQKATQKDLTALNEMAQDRVMGSGLSPFRYGDLERMKVKGTFGENTGDPRAFALEEFYRNQP